MDRYALLAVDELRHKCADLRFGDELHELVQVVCDCLASAMLASLILVCEVQGKNGAAILILSIGIACSELRIAQDEAPHCPPREQP